MAEKILGVLGGMGPEATAYFFQQLIKATPVKSDADHIKTILLSYPQIPDRTQAILGKGESPVEEMVKAARILEQAGVTTIFMPCFTAHYFIETIQARIQTPMANLIKIIYDHIKTEYEGTKKIGILCTNGTKESKIFDKEMQDSLVLYPDDEIQEKWVMQAIYGEQGIKAGYTDGKPTVLLKDAAKHLQEKGADLIVMGCTEIPLALSEDAVLIPTLNSMKIAARHFVKGFKG
ncbi:MAG: amino acid racemase [Thermotaleaceae bacterium]